MSGKTISNVLAICAITGNNQFMRVKSLNQIFQKSCQQLAEKGFNVDVLDLYLEDEFEAHKDLSSSNSKVLEYQIRMNKADALIIFHTVAFDSVPAVLKGFIDNTLVSGFAYKLVNKISIGNFTDKSCLVFAFDERPAIQSLLFGNQLQSFWKKTIHTVTGFYETNFYLIGNYKSMTENEFKSKEKQIFNKINKFKLKKSVLDL